VVERDDRPPVATFYVTSPLESGVRIELSEAAVHHARVKRLAPGDLIQLTDGRGMTAIGDLSSLDKRAATVTISALRHVAPPLAIHLCVPIGDRDRMLLLAEKAAEFGIATWQAIRFRRSMSVSPRGEGEAFGAKIDARMISALEQSGGAWLPQRLPDCAIDEIDVPATASRILLDIDGDALLRVAGCRESALVFGPEGGLEPSERETLQARGWRPARLTENTLRFETAGIAAVAVIRAAHLAQL
jgi:16S rRNA (uracil1498-N3)-methyltransferase